MFYIFRETVYCILNTFMLKYIKSKKNKDKFTLSVYEHFNIVKNLQDTQNFFVEPMVTEFNIDW